MSKGMEVGVHFRSTCWLCQLSLLGPGGTMVTVLAVLEFSSKQEDK